MEQNNKTYISKIKILEQSWHGWSPDGANIPPKETIIEKKSGSYLLIQKRGEISTLIAGEENQKTENRQLAKYNQKEGFRIFISPKIPDQVDFIPEVKIENLEGKEFPVSVYLPLQNEKLKIEESFELKTNTKDMGVTFTITLLDILLEDN